DGERENRSECKSMCKQGLSATRLSTTLVLCEYGSHAFLTKATFSSSGAFENYAQSNQSQAYEAEVERESETGGHEGLCVRFQVKTNDQGGNLAGARVGWDYPVRSEEGGLGGVVDEEEAEVDFDES